MLARPLAFYALSRLTALLAVVVGVASTEERTVVDALGAWDGEWYLQVATHGYPTVDPHTASATVGNLAGNGAFFPLFPLTIRATAGLTGLSIPVAAVTVPVVVGAAAAVLLWLLVRRLAGRQVADRAVVLFCFFPGSFVLSMAYAEAMMLTFAVACLWALLARRWLTAGVAGALATATRPNAVVLWLCCLWAAAAAIRRDRDWRAVLAPLLAPLGILGHLGLLWARTGEPLAWFIIQRQGWNEPFDFGWRLARRFGRLVGLAPPPADIGAFMVPAGVVFVIVAGVVLWRWRPPAELTIYTVGIVALAAIPPELGPRPRFVFTAFPLIVALAWAARGWVYQLLVVTSAALLPTFMVLYAVDAFAPP